MNQLQSHPLFQKYNLENKDLNALKHLYIHGIRIGKPYYPTNIQKVKCELIFQNDHNDSLKLFDRIFVNRYGFSTSCGLARVFHFDNELEYFSFMTEISSVLLLGYYVTLQNSNNPMNQ